ncbi:MAG: class I SAM-dependent methyltransferase [Promethearchaeota archaeon]
MEIKTLKPDKLSGIEKTLLIPLLSRALDSKSPKPILGESKAAELVDKIDFDFTNLENSLDKDEMMGHALRARYFDNQVRQYLSRFPNGIVVSIGSGLDSRFNRIDNGKLTFFDLDLPEVINIRRKLLSESSRNQFIGCSVLDKSWMVEVASIASKHTCPVLFIAEAVFMYLPREDVEVFFQQLGDTFPKAELVFDVYSNFMVKMVRIMLKRSGLKQFQAEFKWGVKNSREIESWLPNLQLISDWSFFNEPELRTSILRHIPFITKMTQIVHYKFTEAHY